MTASEVGKWVLSILGGATVVATGVIAIFRTLGERWLDRKLESHRASLGRLTEHLKYDLQRDMLKAQLSTGKMHEVYPVLFEKVVRAHGAVSGVIGIGFAPSYEGCDAVDFVAVIEAAKLPHGEGKRLQGLIDRDRQLGVQELKAVLRRVEIQRARVSVFRAKNYAALKSLHLSPTVREMTAAFIAGIWSCWVEIHLNEEPGNLNRTNPYRSMKAVEPKLRELELQMSAELNPQGAVAATSASAAGVALPLPGAIGSE